MLPSSTTSFFLLMSSVLISRSEGFVPLRLHSSLEEDMMDDEALDSLINVNRMSFHSSHSLQSLDSLDLSTSATEESEDAVYVNGSSIVTFSGKHQSFSPSNALRSINKSNGRSVKYSENEADIISMNDTFTSILNRPRSDEYSVPLKDAARTAILTRFKEYKLETFTQSFEASKRGKMRKGINLVGILPGKHRNVPGKDSILLFGAHYDTVPTSPGIDDNASGVITILEIARVLSQKEKLDHTILFVAFDLEELGLLGSLALTREYLIPTEMVKNKANWLGAYVVDMALSYENSPDSQILPKDISTALPHVSKKISNDGNRGNFMAVWMRRGVDSHLMDALQTEWSKSPMANAYKLMPFDPALSETKPNPVDLSKYHTFTRSDHASFWYHQSNDFKDSLHAVLLTDMGPWRGQFSRCYHEWCDNQDQLKEKNLNFLKNTIDSLIRVAERPPNKKGSSHPDPGLGLPSVGSGFGSSNGNRGVRRIRPNRRNQPSPPNPTAFQWPTSISQGWHNPVRIQAK